MSLGYRFAMFPKRVYQKLPYNFPFLSIFLACSSQRLPLAYQTLNDAKLNLISTLTILQQTVVNSIIFELSCEFKHVTKGLRSFPHFHFSIVRLNILVKRG